jgi:hypothetical protein
MNGASSAGGGMSYGLLFSKNKKEIHLLIHKITNPSTERRK